MVIKQILLLALKALTVSSEFQTLTQFIKFMLKYKKNIHQTKKDSKDTKSSKKFT